MSASVLSACEWKGCFHYSCDYAFQYLADLWEQRNWAKAFTYLGNGDNDAMPPRCREYLQWIVEHSSQKKACFFPFPEVNHDRYSSLVSSAWCLCKHAFGKVLSTSTTVKRKNNFLWKKCYKVDQISLTSGQTLPNSTCCIVGLQKCFWKSFIYFNFGQTKKQCSLKK